MDRYIPFDDCLFFKSTKTIKYYFNQKSIVLDKTEMIFSDVYNQVDKNSNPCNFV